MKKLIIIIGLLLPALGFGQVELEWVATQLGEATNPSDLEDCAQSTSINECGIDPSACPGDTPYQRLENIRDDQELGYFEDYNHTESCSPMFVGMKIEFPSEYRTINGDGSHTAIVPTGGYVFPSATASRYKGYWDDTYNLYFFPSSNAKLFIARPDLSTSKIIDLSSYHSGAVNFVKEISISLLFVGVGNRLLWTSAGDYNSYTSTGWGSNTPPNSGIVTDVIYNTAGLSVNNTYFACTENGEIIYNSGIGVYVGDSWYEILDSQQHFYTIEKASGYIVTTGHDDDGAYGTTSQDLTNDNNWFGYDLHGDWEETIVEEIVYGSYIYYLRGDGWVYRKTASNPSLAAVTTTPYNNDTNTWGYVTSLFVSSFGVTMAVDFGGDIQIVEHTSTTNYKVLVDVDDSNRLYSVFEY